MPNGDCSCASNVPFRHLDANGHVPNCANWTWEMLWQERLGANLAMAGALCASFDLGWTQRDYVVKSVAYLLSEHWRPGCGRSVP